MNIVPLLVGWLALQSDGLVRVGAATESEIADSDSRVTTAAIERTFTDAPVLGKRFQLHVDAPGTYTIELRSHFFDAYLVLRDERGDALLENDDGLFGTHARITTELAANTRHAIDVCALHGGRGLFEVRVIAGAPPPLTPIERQAAELDDAQRALAIREKVLGPEHPGTAVSLNRLAGLLKASGDLDAAEPLYERALAIRETALGPLHPDTARSLTNWAVVLRARGDLNGALPLLERALAIHEQALGPMHRNTATSLNYLAELLWERGDFDRARPLFERALSIYETVLGPKHANTAAVLNNLATLLWSRGDFEAAQPLFERALAIREETLGPEHPETATILDNLAVLLEKRGDLDAARPLHERALAIREKQLGPDHPATALGLNNLAELRRTAGDLDGALPLAERALAIYEKTLGGAHPETATSLNNLALLRRARGDLLEARALTERALAIWEKSVGPDHPNTALCLSNLSALAFDEGDLVRARELIQRSLRASEAQRISLLSRGSESESRRYLTSLRWQIQLLVSVSPDRDAAEAVLAWKHQAGRALHAERSGLHASLSGENASALEVLQDVQSQLSKLAFARSIEDRELHESEVTRLQVEREGLERLLAGAVDAVLPAAPSLAAVRGALPQRSALVDVFAHRVYQPAQRENGKVIARGRWLERRVSAWITRPDREASVHVDLGWEADVERALNDYLHELVSRRGVAASGDASADLTRALRRLVWDPLAAHLDGVTRVLVSPDGALCTLPFESIALEDGSFLLEHMSFVYEQSADALLRNRGEEALSRSLLSVGGVDYSERAALEGTVSTSPSSDAAKSGAPASRAAVPARDSDSRGSFQHFWAPLRHTSYEADVVYGLHEALARNEKRLALHGPDATEEALKRELSRHAIVHIATHGFFNPEGIPSLWEHAPDETQKTRSGGQGEMLDRAPGLLSGLVCAGANVEPEDEARDDGYLTAEEVGWLDLSRVELVVLSACETALGKAESGEGLLGLRRAFELAGSKTVVSSLWSVKDESTARLMQSFYENLWVKKLGRADALRAAQLEMLAKNRAQYKDPLPSTWGAFVLSGEWR
jgi:CHAT domain-containing protein/Tfp pilus assembly protein PilF